MALKRLLATALFLSMPLCEAAAAPSEEAPEGCRTKDISNHLWRVRNPADLPARIEVPLGEQLEECVKLNGVGEFPMTLTARGIEISINDKPFVKDQPIKVEDGAVLRFRLTAPDKYNMLWTNRLNFEESDPDRRRKIFRIVWVTQTINTPRPPQTWHVGPSHPYREVKDILPDVAAGDTIYLEGDAQYEPVEIKNVPGTKNLPIRLIGQADSPESRPVFSGGTERFNWTLALRNSHNWKIENIVLQDGGLCFRNEATNVTLKNVLIQRCSTGVLSTDRNSGNLTLQNVEVTESGGKGRNWGHGIYVASDQHSFPGSKFTLQGSFLHDNKGNTVKSRFENTLIEGNWIESGTHKEAKYLLELIGYDQKYDFSGQQFRVANNIMIHRTPGLGSRVGGDGNSGSRGDAVFEDNLYVLDEDFGRTIIRTFQGIRSVTAEDNAIVFINSARNTTLITDEIEDKNWVEGHPVVTIKGNLITEDTKLFRRDATNGGDDRSSVVIQCNDTAAPKITDNEKIQALRPTEGGYIEIKSF